jgi:diadenylate cyclase
MGNIFFVNSPLHDGAMIVRDGRFYAAGCYLPLSSNMEISKELGTRHRAALGMSEVSDAAVIVVSEETGMITLCKNSVLNRGISPIQLEEALYDFFVSHGDSTAKAAHRHFSKGVDSNEK